MPKYVLEKLNRNIPNTWQLPTPGFEGSSGSDGSEDGSEHGGSGGQASGIDDGADGRFAFGRPHGPVAVGDLALDDGRSQSPLAGIVGHLDPAGMIQEGQELIARPADLGLERARQVAGTG